MTRRKIQADWGIGIKHCPACGRLNHLKSDACENGRCNYTFTKLPRHSKSTSQVFASNAGNTSVMTRPPHRPTPLRWLLVSLVPVAALIIVTAIGIATSSLHAPVTAQSNLTDRVEALETRVLENNRAIRSLRTDVRNIRATLTAVPTAPPPPTPTPTLTPSDNVLVVTIARGNVRSGPGTNHGVIGSVQQGDILEGPIEEQNGWYQFCCVDDDQFGWISGTLVNVTSRADLTTWDMYRPEAIEISGEELLRNINAHKDKIVYFKATVFQSLQDGMLISIDNTVSQYRTVRLLYDHDPLRVLERDRIEFVAQVLGPYTYQTAQRGSLTVPALHVIALRLLE